MNHMLITLLFFGLLVGADALVVTPATVGADPEICDGSDNDGDDQIDEDFDTNIYEMEHSADGRGVLRWVFLKGRVKLAYTLLRLEEVFNRLTEDRDRLGTAD